MEIPTRQKCKKKKTRKNLDEIRRRSRIEVKDNVSPIDKDISKFHNFSKRKMNNQITSKHLTLSFFNRTIKSKTITRHPLKDFDQKDTNKNQIPLYSGKKSSIISVCNKQSKKLNSASSSLVKTCECTELAYNNCNAHPEIIGKTNNHYIDVHHSPSSAILFSPSNNEHYKSGSVTEEQNDSFHELIVISSSCSSTSDDSEECFYEKFMNVLPNYLKKKFPVLTKESAANKNIAHLKKIYMKNVQNTENGNTPLSKDSPRTLSSKVTPKEVYEHTSKCYRDSIIQNPMDYIQKGRSWQQSLRTKPKCLPSSNFSSASSPLESNLSNAYEHDSPDYIFFPHKLNE